MKILNMDRAVRVELAHRGKTVPLVDAHTGARHLDVHMNILAPGGADGAYHVHPENENVYIILRGKGRFLAEGKEYTVQQHDVVFIPAGVKHSLSVDGPDEFAIIEIYAPLPVRKLDLDRPR